MTPFHLKVTQYASIKRIESALAPQLNPNGLYRFHRWFRGERRTDPRCVFQSHVTFTADYYVTQGYEGVVKSSDDGPNGETFGSELIQACQDSCVKFGGSREKFQLRCLMLCLRYCVIQFHHHWANYFAFNVDFNDSSSND
jgi:hypothetical protein